VVGVVWVRVGMVGCLSSFYDNFCENYIVVVFVLLIFGWCVVVVFGVGVRGFVCCGCG